MSVRSRIAERPSASVEVAKVFGPGTPASFREGEIASQMTPASPFSPGTPIGPYDGYDRTPRAHDFTTGYNIATRPRTHERVSFETLRGLIEAYDVASICLWHRIDSIRSLDWKLLPADHYNGDVTDAVPLGTAALRRPDRINSFKTWLGKYLYDVLAYDAGTLYRLRNRAGRAVGLSVVDGTTIAPLLDYWGNPPESPAEAFVQYVNGLPWNWLTRDDVIYEPFRPRPNSPYGHAPLESVVLNANTDLRFQLYFLQRFCYDEQTEILTRDGWKRLPDVRGDEEFATRSASGDFEWQASKDGKLHVFDSGGTMVQFRNRHVDLLVTPNHRMLTRRKSQGEGVMPKGRDWEWDWHIRRADEFLGRCTVDWRLPITSSWSAPAAVPERFKLTVPTASPVGRSATTKVDMPMWAFARFLGLFIAEGHLRHDAPGKVQRYEINVAQMVGGKLDEVGRILKDTGLNWRYWSDAKTGKFSVGCKALWLYLEQCGRGAENKVLPAEVMDWPAGLLEDLIYGLMTGDGTVNANGQQTYITTSRRLADQVQEIWQKCGVYSSVAASTPHPTSFGKLEQYHVRSRHDVTEFQMPKPEAVPYADNVYCVSVPNGIVLVRRNGKTMWCGNTDGNLPAAFASSPESWSPDQIEQFQAHWDSFMYGDQARKAQIKWMPPGSKFEWSNEKDFTDTFSLFLMRKTCASFHVVPSDLGFTENVNRSSGESQADVQHRVGDLPLMEHVEAILSAFLYDDLHLPLKFEFDRGEEQVDQVAQAEADQKYMDRAVVSSSEIREMRYGLTDSRPVPRAFFTERAGPIPLNSLFALAGEIDPQTAAPAEGAQLPHQVFEETPGTLPNPPLYGQPLAEETYGPKAIPPHTETQSTMPVAKEGEGGAPAPGITSDTGLYGDPLIRDDEDEDREAEQAAAVRKELANFRSHRQRRRKARRWIDFDFRAVGPVRGHNLNDYGRLQVRKDAGEVAVAGLAVLAADTGRVLMLQRALCDDDPAAGKWEFPGGHIEGGETPFAAAAREWSEETGTLLPFSEAAMTNLAFGHGAGWTSGIYAGFVYPVPSEGCVPVRSDSQVTNPDDPDGDQVEAIAWWNPADLRGNPAIRPELAADLDAVMAALGCAPDCCGGECCRGGGGCCGGSGGCTCGPSGSGDGMPPDGAESVCPCGTPVVYDEMNGWQHADGSVSHDDGESVSDKMAAIAKAGGPPKGDPDDWSGIWARTHERRTRLLAGHERAVLAAWNDLASGLSPRTLVRQFREDIGLVAKLAGPDRPWWKDRGRDAALAWLTALRQKKGWAALVAAIEAAIRDGMAEGEADSLAVAANRQGVKGFPVAAAFTVAAQALQGDPEVSQKAQDTAQAILEGTAAALAVTLADGAEKDSGDAEAAAAVTTTVTGPDVAPVKHALADALWSAAGAGLMKLIGKLLTGTPAAPPETGPGTPPAPPPVPPEPGLAMINWVCEGGSPCPACRDNQGGSPYAPQDVPAYLAHNHCMCALYLASDVPDSFFAAYLLN